MIHRERESSWLIALAGVCGGTAILTLTAHWLMFHYFQILLPKDRTAIYLAVLGALFAGALAASPRGSRVLKGALTIVAFYFLLCLRVGYFKEWKWDSDTDKIYAALAHYNHSCGFREVPVNWRYDASLNFYSETSNRETFLQFPLGLSTYPTGKPIYVVHDPEDRAFLQEHGLHEVYHGESGAVVAIDPQAERDFCK